MRTGVRSSRAAARAARRHPVGSVIALVVIVVAAGCAPPTSTSASTDGGVAVAPAATAPAAAGGPVDVVLTDTKGLDAPMTLAPFVSSAGAGDVTFKVKNTGTIEHEMIVLKTDTPFDQLPVVDAGDPPAPVTTGRRQGRRGQPTSARPATPTCKPGETRTLHRQGPDARQVRAGVQPGRALQMGMRAPFTVTARLPGRDDAADRAPRVDQCALVRHGRRSTVP